MPIVLDNRTLVFVFVIVNTSLVAIMAIVWRTSKTYGGFGLWTLANLMLSVGLFLLGLRGIISDFLSIIVANTLEIASPILIFAGIKQFYKRPFHDRLNYVVLICFVILLVATLYIRDDLAARMVLFSLSMGAICLRCTYALWSDVPRTLRTASWLSGGAFTVFAVVNLVRGLVTAVHPEQAALFGPSALQNLFYLTGMIVSICTTSGYLLMTSGREEIDLIAAETELRRLADTDFLTGIPNRRSIFDLGQQAMDNARVSQQSLSILELDIDFFKDVNDTHGHAVGDQVLKGIVSICQAVLRQRDVLARLGGEEFLVIMPATNSTVACELAENMRRLIEGTIFPASSPDIHLTASFGVTSLLPDDHDFDAILRRTDAALYDAKRSGRNCVNLLSADR